MKLQVQMRTISRNGQVAIPKRFLEALGVTTPGIVQVAQEKRAIVIRPSPMIRMSDETFRTFLDRIRRRNRGITQRQIFETIREVRRAG